ncbi:metalloprotease family M67C [Thraustotheca clavata]|uniref:Metalloprotease family M67C n=1 Tax=Thraustotheca clavata TaxID=74557 RepID=A0A1W0A108_9STRA|nr:metalloprotease family M67C [Thraustotheca clavata]
MSFSKDTMESEHLRQAEERVAVRREELKKACVVSEIKNSDSIEKSFRQAHVIYQQCRQYVIQRDYDHAYKYLWLLVILYKDRIPKHKDYNLLKYRREKARLDEKCGQATDLLNRILDGMLQEELAQLKQTHEDEEFILNHEDHESAIVSSPVKAKSVEGLSLEARLSALKALGTQTSPSHETITDNRLRANAMNALKTSRYIAPRPVELQKITPPPVHSHYCSYPSLEARRKSIENKTMLLKEETRQLSIPTMLVQEFIRIADPNTRKHPYGIETCGILAGTLKNQLLTITTLIIPKQTGSSDTCTMTHEEELFEYCIVHDLLTLGWIHTHPSQTCFLSSVDIHTQCGFQSMLPEAIAIVVAPRDMNKSIGVFRLTQPHGMELIQNCNLTGFHEHPTNFDIYSDAIQITWEPNQRAQIEIIRRNWHKKHQNSEECKLHDHHTIMGSISIKEDDYIRIFMCPYAAFRSLSAVAIVMSSGDCPTHMAAVRHLRRRSSMLPRRKTGNKSLLDGVLEIEENERLRTLSFESNEDSQKEQNLTPFKMLHHVRSDVPTTPLLIPNCPVPESPNVFSLISANSQDTSKNDQCEWMHENVIQCLELSLPQSTTDSMKAVDHVNTIQDTENKGIPCKNDDTFMISTMKEEEDLIYCNGSNVFDYDDDAPLSQSIKPKCRVKWKREEVKFLKKMIKEHGLEWSIILLAGQQLCQFHPSRTTLALKKQYLTMIQTPMRRTPKQDIIVTFENNEPFTCTVRVSMKMYKIKRFVHNEYHVKETLEKLTLTLYDNPTEKIDDFASVREYMTTEDTVHFQVNLNT